MDVILGQDDILFLDFIMKPTRTYVLYVLMTIAPTAGVAQELFHGMAVYQMSMGKASAQTYTTYYRGQDIMTEMPQSKMRTLYLESERCMYNVMGMMGKPMVNRYDVNLSTMEVPLFDIGDELQSIDGHSCLRVSYSTGNTRCTTWLDTGYHIPFYYGLDENIRHGLPVRTETSTSMRGMTTKSVTELVSIVAGRVDDALFAVPAKDNVVMMSMDGDGNIIAEGDTTGLFSPVATARLKEVDSLGFRSAIAQGRTVCIMSARWCGPCRLVYPRLENVAKRLGDSHRFILLDIDKNRALAKEYNSVSIPVVILFENGKELRRISSSAYSEDDLFKFIAGEGKSHN